LNWLIFLAGHFDAWKMPILHFCCGTYCICIWRKILTTRHFLNFFWSTNMKEDVIKKQQNLFLNPLILESKIFPRIKNMQRVTDWQSYNRIHLWRKWMVVKQNMPYYILIVCLPYFKRRVSSNKFIRVKNDHNPSENKAFGADVRSLLSILFSPLRTVTLPVAISSRTAFTHITSDSSACG